MKKSLLFAFFIIASTTLFAQVNFTKAAWEDVLKEAQKEKKYVFLDAYTDWCGWCKVMDRKTFSDAGVGTYMDKHFVSTKIEMEKEETGRMLAKKHGVNLYPTFLILDSKGNLLLRMEGFQEPASFLKTLEDFIKGQK